MISRIAPSRQGPSHLLSAMLTVVVLLFCCWGCSGSTPPAGERSLSSGSLQEMAPPPAIQQVRERLASHNPEVRIERPRNGARLPEGRWTLDLSVHDWPVLDAGELGPGPHVVVQIDDDPPLRVTTVENGRAELTLDQLAPGSHRITAYAARPWGESVKGPQASSRVIVHRLAPLPGSQPTPGTAWLVPVSPDSREASGLQPMAEPVLVDWLLWDAPLQHLGADDDQWRLRITVNGDSALVDRQSPLWLTGFQEGDNVVILELLDALGEPLNPPFNGVVRGVRIDRNTASSPWLQGRLSENDLNTMLGLRSIDAPAAAIPIRQSLQAEEEQPAAASPIPADDTAAGGDETTDPLPGIIATPPAQGDDPVDPESKAPTEEIDETVISAASADDL